jgi:uncharacterized membrane protein
MKIFKIILLILLIVFVGIQFIPTKRNQSDSVPKNDFMLVNKVPKNINNLIQTSCYDCHSNNTVYPWYSNIQPGSWFMENHIVEGKKELNFNEFGNYSIRKQKSKLKAIAGQIKSDDMPLTSYTLLHRNAILTKENKALLIHWLTKTKDSLSKIN